MRAGYYGKIPAKGDFLRYNCHPDFIRIWDQWLQSGFLASRDRLGAGWQAAYETAPIWRFLLAAGVCGPEPVLGVMMPSQDRVGRMFPLTIVLRLRENTTPLALQTDPLMTELENAALACLQDGQGVEDLQNRLRRLVLPALPQGDSGGSCWLSTFYNGQNRLDERRYGALPAETDFADLLLIGETGGKSGANSGGEAGHV